MSPSWHRYAELRPDQIAVAAAEAPVAFWPLGLLEHHGWHLPVGYDGIKADRICQRIAERTGGLILPIMWWAGSGGHDVFRWSHYQDESAFTAILATTTRQLIHFDFRSIVLLAGHYPWQTYLDKYIPPIQKEHPEVQILYGTEMTIGGDAVQIKGDHAAREETSFGLALLPEFTDLDALTPGRDDSVWPHSAPPPEDKRHPHVNFEAADPLFAQMGEDARLASAKRAEAGLGPLVDHLAQSITRHLKEVQ